MVIDDSLAFARKCQGSSTFVELQNKIAMESQTNCHFFFQCRRQPSIVIDEDDNDPTDSRQG
jgi:hypothetical protein